MSKPLEILIDSDAFVGRFYPDDVHYQQATRIFAQLEQAGKQIVSTNLVIMETATVLSHRSGQVLARKFLAVLDKTRLPIIHINEKLHQESLSFFKKQDKKGTSLVDCANVVVMRRFAITSIFSFDKFYARQPGIQMPQKAGLL